MESRCLASLVPFVQQASAEVALAGTDIIHRCPFDALEAGIANAITVPSAPSDTKVHHVRKVFVHLGIPIAAIIELREIVAMQSVCLCTFVARLGGT